MFRRFAIPIIGLALVLPVSGVGADAQVTEASSAAAPSLSPVFAYLAGEGPQVGSAAVPIKIATGGGSSESAVSVGGNPDTVAITPDGRIAYVASVESGTVTPILTATNEVGSAITVGGGPTAIAITPDSRTAYVVNDFSNSVTPIDTATDTAEPAIPVGADPVFIAITPDGKTAYVANASSDTVTPIDIATNTAGPAISVGQSPYSIAITPNGKTAYVANDNSNTITPIDTANNTAEAAIQVEQNPNDIAITPNGKTAYVTSASFDNVTPINTATNKAKTAIPVGAGPVNIAITPNGKTAYVANEQDGTVSPISTATNTAGAAIPVGSDPVVIAITPNGKTAYVGNAGSFSVTPIATATNTVGTAIPVDVAPPSPSYSALAIPARIGLKFGKWPGTAGPGIANSYYGYPYSDPPACTDGGACLADQWDFFQGQCTSWVAYRINQLSDIPFSNTYDGSSTDTWGPAANWGPHAMSLASYGITVDTTPTPGSIAWYSSGEGHVAYVEWVNSPTSVVISEMNYDNDNGFRIRTITPSSGWPTDFIHIPGA